MLVKNQELLYILITNELNKINNKPFRFPLKMPRYYLSNWRGQTHPMKLRSLELLGAAYFFDVEWEVLNYNL